MYNVPKLCFEMSELANTLFCQTCGSKTNYRCLTIDVDHTLVHIWHTSIKRPPLLSGHLAIPRGNIWNDNLANRWEFCLSMRKSTNACVPRDVSCDKRGKFCKHLNRFKIKINNMNEENFAAFFVLLAFMELFFTVASFIGEANNNKRKTRAFAQQENGKVL